MQHRADPAYMKKHFIRFTSKVGNPIFIYRDTPISAVLDCDNYRKIYTDKHFYMVRETVEEIFQKFRQSAIETKDIKRLQ